MTSLADTLPQDCIDLCFGEATVVRHALLKHFSFPDIQFTENSFVTREKYSHKVTYEHPFSYPHPSGYQPLVKLLEHKHNAPVIITNGAKQALAAMFYV